ncbi:MAG: hypothetical protein WC525_04395 [Candidatus Thermoplasmatota archaeon]
MITHLRTTLPSTILLLCLFLGSVPLQTLGVESAGSLHGVSLDAVLQQGRDDVRSEQNIPADRSNDLIGLGQWYNHHPLVDYATVIGTSITVKFRDGSYTVLLDPFLEEQTVMRTAQNRFLYESDKGDGSKTAIILNPAESMYGHYQCQRIIATLLRKDYSIEYLANQAVDIGYLRQNLSADIVYMNTHAGYFDVDGDQQADAVVIATGELWTNETIQKYPYEYQHQLIIKGMVGDQGYVAFTPAFIEHYYAEGSLPDSLVFMATCYAVYDSSMAQSFLDAGANVYVGWSNNTVFWTNSRTSVHAFRLFSLGLTVQQVCRLIRSGGFYNWLFHSKLLYVGDGTYRIP